MRIVLLTRSFEIGGAETQIVALAKGLQQGGHSVTMACFYAVGPLLQETIDAGIPVMKLEKKGRWDIFGFVARLGTRIAQERPEIVQSYLGPPNILVALANKNLDGAKIVWGIRASNMNLRNYDWSWRVATWLERALAGRARHIVSNSHAGIEQAMKQGLPTEKISVIANGIDIERFKPDPTAGIEVRQEWGLPIEAPLIGIVARFDPMKDHEMFLRAAARLSERRPEARYVCIGDGPEDYVKHIKSQATAFGLGDKIIWPGARRDMPAIYNALDVLALTSSYGEGFPNTLGEAMACGTPCAATAVGDAEMIIGNCGMVVTKGDDDAMAKAWDQLLKETNVECADRRTNCRNRVADTFSVAAMINSYTDLYRQLLQGTD